MRKLFIFIRTVLKRSFDNIKNERLKHNLLQAIPFWIGSIITGFFAVFYAKVFEWGEHFLNFVLNWNAWMIFILAPLGFVVSWLLIRKSAPYAKGSGIPQVMAAIELANPKE